MLSRGEFYPSFTDQKILIRFDFDRIRKFPPITNLEDNDKFCSMMQATLDKHQVVIPEVSSCSYLPFIEYY